MPKVLIPTPLRQYAGQHDAVVVEGTTVGEALTRLTTAHPDLRRQGIGSALLLATHEWGLAHESRNLVLEIQPKNYPAIRMAQKLGFEFCGYNDRYFANRDIGLFFAKSLR